MTYICRTAVVAISKTISVLKNVTGRFGLQGEDISFLSAENGWVAVELVLHHPEINLVLMDLKMPVMDGYEASWLIKVLRPLLATLSPSLLLPLMR